MKALVNSLSEDVPSWAAIFIPESDSSSLDLDYTEDAHLHLRHKPGKGSRPMRLIVHSRFKSNMTSCKWLGRSGALTLGSVCLIGTHGALGDGLAASLVDTATLIKRRAWGTVPVVLGDHNIDILPVQSFDPWAETPDRSSKHAQERGLLYAWLDATGLSVSVPNACITTPAGRWKDACFLAPVSRIPPEASVALPSLLDYSCHKHGIVRSSWLSWASSPGDHAALFIELGAPLIARKWAKSHWIVTDKDACQRFMASHLAEPPDTWQKCLNAVKFAQNMFGDHKTCRARSAERFPEQAKDLLMAAHGLPPEEATEARSQAWSLGRSRLKSIAIAKVTQSVTEGKPPNKTTKLWKILSLSSKGTLFNSSEEWGPALRRHYSSKWGGHSLAAREVIMDYCYSTNGLVLEISKEEVRTACAAIKHRNRLDREGLCVNALALWNESGTNGTASTIAKLMASNSSCQAQQVHARVFGKSSGHTELSDTRVILPLGAIAQIADVLISCRLNIAIDAILPPQSGTFIGARPGTQSAEIALAAQLWVEKALDCGSTGALVQEDVAGHFDTLAMPLIMQWLIKHHVDAALIGAAMRAQMLPEVITRCQAAECSISGRSTGGLTGSRVAGALARIPIEQTISDLAASARSQGFLAGSTRLTYASYVDNVFVLGKDGASAVLLADQFEKVLATQWKQAIKPSSREIMVPRGALVGRVNLQRWKQVDCMRVLGMCIQDNAESNLTWAQTEKQCMTLYFRRAYSGLSKLLNPAARVKIVNLVLKPFLLFKMAASPLSTTRLYQIEKLQRRVYLGCAGLQRHADEQKDEWHKRRSSSISAAMEKHGLWHSAVARAHTKFAEHIARSEPRKEWAATFDAWRDPEVHRRRMQGLRVGRLWPGHVAATWRSEVAERHAHDVRASEVKTRTW